MLKFVIAYFHGSAAEPYEKTEWEVPETNTFPDTLQEIRSLAIAASKEGKVFAASLVGDFDLGKSHSGFGRLNYQTKIWHAQTEDKHFPRDLIWEEFMIQLDPKQFPADLHLELQGVRQTIHLRYK